jgi:hypothetical protein
MASLLLYLVLPLLLLLLLCSSDGEPYLLLRFPRCRSPSSIITNQWLSLTVESQDTGVRPVPDGVVKWVNHQSTRLSHRLNSSSGVSEPDGSTLGDGSTGGGSGGAARVSEVSEDGGVVSVSGASGPWGWPRGPTEMHVVQ